MGRVPRVDFGFTSKFVWQKTATAHAQSETSVMVVFFFNENIVEDMAVSHQVK